MTTRKLQVILLYPLLFSLLLSTCIPSTIKPTPTVNPNVIRTQAVATFASSLTEAVAPVQTGTSTPIPSPTTTIAPVNTTTNVPANPCYKLRWLSDVTIPDNTPMTPGQTFTKTWKVQNTGGCAWAPGFTFSLIGGDAMGGKTLTLKEPVPSGAEYKLSIDMTTPTGQSGVIKGTWQMADKNGSFFGDTPWVVIVIGEPIPGSPSSTATP